MRLRDGLVLDALPEVLLVRAVLSSAQPGSVFVCVGMWLREPVHVWEGARSSSHFETCTQAAHFRIATRLRARLDWDFDVTSDFTCLWCCVEA